MIKQTLHMKPLNSQFVFLQHVFNLRWRFGTSEIDLNPPLVFTTDRSKAVVLMCVLCVALWLLAAGLFACFVLFAVLLLLLADPV